MYKIAVVDNISAGGLSHFDKERYQYGKEMENPEAILVRSSNLHDYSFGNNLLAVGRAGVGTDNIPVEQLTELGIPVFFAPGANSNAVKELVLAAMLIGFRSLNHALHFTKSLKISDKSLLKKEIEAQKKNFVGKEIMGKVLGVVGLGNIGVKIANAAQALGMEVIAFDPQMTMANALALSPLVRKTDDLEKLFSHADVITIHVPLTPETQFLVNAKRMALMKPASMLLNFSREDVVDETALLAHLHKHSHALYVTDFMTPAFRDNPQIIGLPHLGASTLEAMENSSVMVIQNICNYLEFGIIQHAVNFPDIQLATPGYYQGKRMVIINKNQPGVIAKISSILSESGLNIDRMVNSSRDRIAVNLVDVSGHATNHQNLMNKLKNVEEVTKVRCLTVDS